MSINLNNPNPLSRGSVQLLEPEPKHKPVERDVPCGTCHACCRNRFVYLFPDDGDSLDKYRVVYHRGQPVLATDSLGDCVYLDDAKGCTIHEDKPWSCKEFDCRLMMLNPPQVYKRIMNKHQIRAAKKLMKGMKRDMDNKKRLEKLNAKK